MRTERKQTLSSLFHSIYYHGNDVIFYRMNDFYKMNGAYRIFLIKYSLRYKAYFKYHEKPSAIFIIHVNGLWNSLKVLYYNYQLH